MAIQAVSGERTRKRSRRRHRHPWLRRAARFLIFLAAIVLFSIVVFRFVNPPITPVMLVEKLKGNTLRRDWVPLEDISPQLPLAVIASEDGRFCVHWGVDWGAVRDAVKEGGGLGAFRGASTIPMQTAKNLYLWNGRSYVRKALEMPLAYVMSFIWPKQRMIEVYLNVAQFGPGIFGAEAASRYYFHKPAADLTRHEAVLLAVALPNPRWRNPAKPSRHMLLVARAVERRMPVIGQRAGCVLPQR
ncbi:MAG: monofunctional biosynthetic peptidoglycan transglycosylase [Methyloceanibacter sp.]|nr:monofunctional biosynthetic peptidoglycan transglycosylase [Methyloceanibacter sp.]